MIWVYGPIVIISIILVKEDNNFKRLKEKMKEELKLDQTDTVLKNMLQDRKNLAQFYYDLTGRKINPDDISYEKIEDNFINYKRPAVTFKEGITLVNLFEIEKSLKINDIYGVFAYMCLLFVQYVEKNEEELFERNKELIVPAVESFVIYTGNEELPEIVSLDDLSKENDNMLHIKMEIAELKNAKGMVREYIEFMKQKKEYSRNSKMNISDLIDFCVKNNILKDYLSEHKEEVIHLVEKSF